jgi:putative inorganic carbon (hco3(-)) transporter
MKKLFSKYFLFLSDINLSFLFFLFFTFCLFFQKKISFFSDYSFLEGRYIDYLAYSLYGFEVFLGIAFIFWLWEIFKEKRKVIIGDKKIFLSVLLLILFSFASISFAVDKNISLYYILVLIELLVFFIFTVNLFKIKKNLNIFLNVFLIGMFFQSVIAILQFALNHSLSLNLLGESPLSAALPGVAKTVIGGVKHIRAYGTFPHPNILALFLLVSGIINIHLFKISKDKRYRIFLVVLFLFSAIALFLTFSRIAWVLAFIFWGIYIYQISNLKSQISKIFKNKRNLLIFCFFVFLFFCFFVYFAPAIWWRIDPFIPSTWDSLNVRLVVIEKSWLLIKDNIWGIGIGNFVIEIAYQLTGYPSYLAEPVHNTFILVLTEIGLLGLLSFLSILFFIFRGFKKLPDFLKYIFLVMFVYMFFDHCFWDIRQTQFLLFLFIGINSLFISRKKESQLS